MDQAKQAEQISEGPPLGDLIVDPDGTYTPLHPHTIFLARLNPSTCYAGSGMWAFDCCGALHHENQPGTLDHADDCAWLHARRIVQERTSNALEALVELSEEMGLYDT